MSYFRTVVLLRADRLQGTCPFHSSDLTNYFCFKTIILFLQAILLCFMHLIVIDGLIVDQTYSNIPVNKIEER